MVLVKARDLRVRLSDLVACDRLTLITFSNNFDPDQARQMAASDRSLQCLQDSDIIIIIIIHFSEPSMGSV